MRDKFEAQDLEALESKLTKVASVSKQAPTKVSIKDGTGFVRVAFDMFKNNDDNGMWQLVSEADGEYFIRISDTEPNLNASDESEKTKWSAVQDENKNVVLAYQGYPIHKFASAHYGFASEEAGLFKQFVLSKTADKDFCTQLVRIQPPAHKEEIVKRFPELKG